MGDQAEDAGCERHRGESSAVARREDGFAAETSEGDRYRTHYVIAATKHAADYLAALDGVGAVDRGKTFVDTAERGRTGAEDLDAAGRLAEKPRLAATAARLQHPRGGG
jgi:hypothetical protein